jgi:sugar/nucleoside kinase (ribokinase family)
VVLPVGGEGAMVTVDHGVRAYASEVAAFEPRVVVATLQVLHTAPVEAERYVVCGDDDAGAYAGRPPAELDGARALFLSARETLVLSGADTVEAGAAQLSEKAATVIVCLEDDSLLALSDGRVLDVPRVDPGRAVDRTGTRDLLAAAHCWAALRGADPAACVAWAALYGTIAARAATPLDGAVNEATLRARGISAGLTLPRG